MAIRTRTGLPLHEQIKSLREKRGMSQIALADKIGTTQSVVSRMESAGYRVWKVSTLEAIARALGVSLSITLGSADQVNDEDADFLEGV